jgi:carbonic anhydrase
MELAQPAYDWVQSEYGAATLPEKATLCEQYALINSLHNLRSFPWIQERIDKQLLKIHAWHFELATGAVHIYDESTMLWKIS